VRRTGAIRVGALAAVAAVVVSPWAVPADAAVTPLPDMASVAQVVGAPAAWQAGATGAGVDVAVIDTGVTPVTGLHGSNKLLYGPDLSFDSQDPNRIHVDGYGHGTAMAGIIAGNDETPGGYKGIAPDARIVSVKVGASNGAVDVSQIIAGIDWVTEHARDDGLNIRVINLSLGTNSVQSWQLDPLSHAAEVAWRKGIVVVVSVGNDGTDSKEVANPAINPYLLAVGASDPQGTVAIGDDTVASFSQRGTGSRKADVVAPGAYVMGLNAPGSTLATQYPNAVFGGGRFFRGSGSSQSAAVVAGMAADILSVRPSLTPDQVKAVITSTAVKIGTPNPNFIGHGLVQLPAALNAPAPSTTQYYGVGSGAGSLQAARGTGTLALNGVALTGEKDIFGKAWNSSAMGQAEETLNAWNGGDFNGSTWSGSTWSGSTWSGSTWSGSTWSGSTWSGSTWSGSTWSGSTWSGSTWSGSTWSGSTWSGSTWSGSTWSGSTWSGDTWMGATWN